MEIRVNGLEQGLEQLQKNLDSPQLLATARELITKATASAFRNERDPVTEQPWQKLKTKRLGKILHQTGALQASLWVRWDKGRLQIGYSSPYAQVHQLGTKDIPARPFLGVSAEVWQRIKDNVRESCVQGI